jgi:hypothetical protein
MRSREVALARLSVVPRPGAAQADHPSRPIRPVVRSAVGGGNGSWPGRALGAVAVVGMRVPARYEGAA